MSIFSHADLANVNQAVAQKFAPNASEVVALVVEHTSSQFNTFHGVVADSTTGVVSYVPFVAGASPLRPGYSKSTTVTLHTDKAAPALANALTNMVGLMGEAAAAQDAKPEGVEPDLA